MSVVIDLWKTLPGKFFCIATKDRTKEEGGFREYFFAPDEFGKIKQFLKDNRHLDIYFCPHGFNRRVRQKQEAVLPNLLWADLDYSDPRNGNKLFKGLKPTILIETSDGRFAAIWRIDKVMKEDFNKALTYFVEADPSGWDVTQLLRFPGTRNHKYPTTPLVRTVWFDGPNHRMKTLKKIVPELEGDDDVEGELLDFEEVWSAYERQMPRWLRKNLQMKKIVGVRDRSDTLWKMEREMLEMGMTQDECFTLLWNSVWNKFRDRRNGESILRQDLAKAAGQAFKAKPKGKLKLKHKSDEDRRRDDDHQEGGFFDGTPLSEVKMEDIDWLWYPYLARKEVTIVEGDPGFGKSYFMQMVAAQVATGKKLPNHYKGKGTAHGAVAYFDLENTDSTVTLPRLVDSGFERKSLNQLHIRNKAWTIDAQEIIEPLYEWLEDVRPSLIVFDTLNGFIGRADTHKASEAAQAMSFFKQLAMDFNCSVVVIRHLVKGSSNVSQAGQGSAAMLGTARIGIIVGCDPDDTDVRVLKIHKNNIGPEAPALEFHITGNDKGRADFEWGEFRLDLGAQGIMDGARQSKKGDSGSKVQAYMEFIEKECGNKKVDKSKLFMMAEKRSLDVKILQRIARKMKVKMSKGSSGERWILPLNDIDDDED